MECLCGSAEVPNDAPRRQTQGVNLVALCALRVYRFRRPAKMCSGWREVRAQRFARCATSKFKALLENEVKKRAEPERASGCKTLASKRLEGFKRERDREVFSGFSGYPVDARWSPSTRKRASATPSRAHNGDAVRAGAPSPRTAPRRRRKKRRRSARRPPTRTPTRSSDDFDPSPPRASGKRCG